MVIPSLWMSSESACKELNIVLFVLPPKNPKYNGGVERGNRIFREEFYAKNDILADSVGAIKAELKSAVWKYNSYRPHKSLDYLTPMQYLLPIKRPIDQSNVLCTLTSKCCLVVKNVYVVAVSAIKRN
jgi:putative transposase